MVSWDPKIFHQLPASALWSRVGALSSEGREIIEVTRAQIPPDVWGRDPEHGPEKDQSDLSAEPSPHKRVCMTMNFSGVWSAPCWLPG